MACLIAVEGPLAGQRFPLHQQLVVGRALDADIRILDTMVTRRHCLISAAPGGYTVQDLGSRNGTRLNDVYVTNPTLLKRGDIIRVQNSAFRFLPSDDTTSSVMLLDRKPTSASTVVEAIAVSDTITPARLSLAAQGDAARESLAVANRRLQTVIEIGNSLGRHLSLDDLLNGVMDSFFRLFPQVDRGAILLMEGEGSEMTPRLSRTRAGDSVEAIPVSRHIVEEAVRQQAGILSADATDDSRFAAAQSVLNFSIRSMMCAPLMAAGKPLGAIHLDTMQAGRHFTRDDLALFTAIANQTAVALHSTRMHEELRKRQSVEQDLAMARHVQHSFLPADLPRLPGFDFAASYRAALEVGGDFYDFIALPDGRLGIAVGDVMGKGMPAALMMVRVMSDMRYLAIANPEPAFVLERLNAGLARSGSGNAFVTLVFMLLDPTTRRLTLANAGHYPPLLRCAGGEVKEVDDVESGLPLGAEPDMRYEQESVALGEGDCLVAFTDGVTEAESAAEELYGTERLRAALRAAGPTAACVVSHLLEDIRNFVGDTPQSDDLTLVSMKISPSAARPKPEGDVSTDIAPAPSSAAP